MLLIFDLDGTLIDSLSDISEAVNLTRSTHGLPPLPSTIIAGYIGDGAKKLLSRALEGAEIQMKEALLVYGSHYKQRLHKYTALYPGVREGLRELKEAGFSLALLSNKPVELCRELLRHFQLIHLFSEVAGDDGHSPLKPDPESVLMIMRKLNFSPSDTWIIGDSNNDIEAGARAGTRTAFVSYGIGRLGTTRPNETFNSFSDLARFLIRKKEGNGKWNS